MTVYGIKINWGVINKNSVTKCIYYYPCEI